MICTIVHMLVSKDTLASQGLRTTGPQITCFILNLIRGLSMVINTNLIIDKFCNNDLNYRYKGMGHR